MSGRLKGGFVLGLAAGLLAGPPAQATAPATIALSGGQALTISLDTTVTGPITLRDDSVLTITGATVHVAHPQTDPRANIILTDRARLVLTNATLRPVVDHPDNLYLSASGQSSISITNSAFINVIDLRGKAVLTGAGARIASSLAPINIPEGAGAFGIVQLGDQAHVTLTDSTVGSIGFFLSAADDVRLAGLRPRMYADFDLARDAERWTPQFDVALRNTRVLPVQLHGPFERSWTIAVDPAARLVVTDSSLNKLCLQPMVNETLTFRDLPIDTPGDFDFRDIHLVNTSVANEWGFFAQDSNITVENSKGVWLWPSGTGRWVLRNSQMIEFDPREFTGTLTFVHGEWANAGEVFQGSAVNLRGSFTVTQHLGDHLVMDDSTMTREYSVRAVDAHGRFVRTFAVTLRRGKEAIRTRTTNGLALATIGFNVTNYRKPFVLSVTALGTTVEKSISLFSTTPIALRLPR